MIYTKGFTLGGEWYLIHLHSKNKGIKQMTKLTSNQTAALAVFHNSIESESDFEWGDYFWMDDLIEMLTENGWERKSAEGTIGSLLESSGSGLQEFEMTGHPEKGEKREMLYVVFHKPDLA